MECKGIREKLAAYLEEALSSEEKRLVEQHLIACPQCRDTLEDLEKTRELVGELGEVEPPDWLSQKIMARVRAEQEKKRGIFQKLFYPLHVKVPIEALATVLIAVVAVYVFRAVEPEMKQAGLPAPPATVITREEAPKPPPESAADSMAPSGKVSPKKQPERDRATAVSPPPAPTPPLSRPSVGPLARKKKEPLAERQEEGMAVPQERESSALSEAGKDTRERKKLAAPSRVLESAAMKPGAVEVMVSAKDAKVTGGDLEHFLGQVVGARNIRRESLEGREILTAELKAQNMKALLDKLKTVGEIKEKSMPSDASEGDVPIRVEIISAP